MALGEQRTGRWWLDRAPVRTIEEAAAFVDDVGIALLFPKDGVALPTLWEVVCEPGAGAAPVSWGSEMERIWAWKDELPVRRLAWRGKLVRGLQSAVSPSMLVSLYGTVSDPLEDHTAAVLDVVGDNGPISTAELRTIVGRRQADHALRHLGRRLLVTHLGTESGVSGWPSVLVERTDAVFAVSDPTDDDERAARRRAVAASLGAVRDGLTARELATVAGWTAAEAREAMA